MEFSLDESPAAEALGPMFKLTEVHLWDDASIRELPYIKESMKVINSYHHACEQSCSTRTDGFGLLPEDLELEEKMNVLGLPLSFLTNKEKRNGLNGGKRKGRKKNYEQSLLEINDIMLDSLKMDEEDSSFEPYNNILETSERYTKSDLEFNFSISPSTNGLGAYDLCTNDITSKGSCLLNENADFMQDAGGDAYTYSLDEANSNALDDHIKYWDDYLSGVHFKTEEDQWLEMEQHLNFSDTGNLMLKVVDDMEASFDLLSCGVISRYGQCAGDGSNKNTLKRKKRSSRTKSNSKLSNSSEDLQGVLREDTPSISKYWCQRYLLFSRYDQGIEMDEEGWFSVTPESIAVHHAVRCGDGLILDLFAGVGGNAIQFALQSKHVIAIDIDPNKIGYARHNATIYGANDNIDFIEGDSFSLASSFKVDTVFMSPPWGGPNYSKVKRFDINTMLKPRSGKYLFDIGTKIAAKIVMFLPRNVDINQLAELSLSTNPPWSLEVEKNYLNGRLKAITAYFSEPSSSSVLW